MVEGVVMLAINKEWLHQLIDALPDEELTEKDLAAHDRGWEDYKAGKYRELDSLRKGLDIHSRGSAYKRL